MPLPAGISFLTPTLPVYVFDAPEPGPTALIQGGIHGNEVAGTHALQELLEEGLRPHRGRLIIVPVMNPAAYRARQRMAPGGHDLNRCFPGDPSAPEPERRLAARFMELVADERPALMATLHESLKRFHPQVPQSFGQTVVYGVQPTPQIVQRVVDQMNTTLQSPYELWAPHYYPVATSSTEVIVEKFGCIGLCIETWEVFEERRRIDMQRQIVRLLLEEIGVLDRS
jgi:predicted deacylase